MDLMLSSVDAHTHQVAASSLDGASGLPLSAPVLSGSATAARPGDDSDTRVMTEASLAPVAVVSPDLNADTLSRLPDFKEIVGLFEADRSKPNEYDSQVAEMVTRIVNAAKELYSQEGLATIIPPSDDFVTLEKSGPKLPVRYYNFANVANYRPVIGVFMDGETPRLYRFGYGLVEPHRKNVVMVKFSEAGRDKLIEFMRVEGTRLDGEPGWGTFGIHANALAEQYPSLA